VKKIGFLSFGHWMDHPDSQVRSAADTLVQSIDLAQAAEEVGADGAYFRVHHYAQQLGSPTALLAAVGAKTQRIELGTGVVDMRYPDPFGFAEDMASVDLISGGRLQLGLSRGTPEQVIDGWKYFGISPEPGETDADMARRKTLKFLEGIEGHQFAQPNPRPMFPNPPGLLRLEPYAPGLRERIWWGAGSDATARWTAEHGMNLMSSTLKDDETGEPFHVQQRKQIDAYREAWAQYDHGFSPRVSVSRSIFALTTDIDRLYFAGGAQRNDQFGSVGPGNQSVFGRTYADEPEALVEQLREDEAIAAADTLLLTVPTQLGVDFNAHLIENIIKYVAPELGWR
jgi:alkanesulfonate monooxygenase SsuD/methylene tetrahydromethanopterin reductase-like flavin-dependent oxidoreductase (luciferase family)